MQNKSKIISKINTIATILLFAGIFLEIFFPIFKYVTLVSSCCIYISILINNRLKTGKFDISLVILCSISLIWVFLRGFMTSPYLKVFGMVILYSFLIRASKLTTGKWNRFVFIYGTVAVVCSVINIYVDSKFLDWGIFALQIFILFKFLDPILEKIGLEHREKRLAQEADQKRLAEEQKKKKSNQEVIIETEGSEVRHG